MNHLQIAAALDSMLENLVGLKAFGHFNFIATVKTVFLIISVIWFKCVHDFLSNLYQYFPIWRLRIKMVGTQQYMSKNVFFYRLKTLKPFFVKARTALHYVKRVIQEFRQEGPEWTVVAKRTNSAMLAQVLEGSHGGFSSVSHFWISERATGFLI